MDEREKIEAEIEGVKRLQAANKQASWVAKQELRNIRDSQNQLRARYAELRSALDRAAALEKQLVQMEKRDGAER